jgi:hypothetical protein
VGRDSVSKTVTPERLAEKAAYLRKWHAARTPEQRAADLAKRADRAKLLRESDPAWQAKRLERERREKLTDEERRAEKLDYHRRYNASHPETPEQSARKRARRKERLAKLTPEQIEARSEELRRRNKLTDERRADARRADALHRKYGITIRDYQSMESSQGGRCAICDRGARSTQKLHIDHCHDTGAVRGLLCKQCNMGIGLLGDKPDRVARAAHYLRRAESNPPRG